MSNSFEIFSTTPVLSATSGSSTSTNSSHAFLQKSFHHSVGDISLNTTSPTNSSNNPSSNSSTSSDILFSSTTPQKQDSTTHQQSSSETGASTQASVRNDDSIGREPPPTTSSLLLESQMQNPLLPNFSCAFQADSSSIEESVWSQSYYYLLQQLPIEIFLSIMEFYELDFSLEEFYKYIYMEFEQLKCLENNSENRIKIKNKKLFTKYQMKFLYGYFREEAEKDYKLWKLRGNTRKPFVRKVSLLFPNISFNAIGSSNIHPKLRNTTITDFNFNLLVPWGHIKRLILPNVSLMKKISTPSTITKYTFDWYFLRLFSHSDTSFQNLRNNDRVVALHIPIESLSTQMWSYLKTTCKFQESIKEIKLYGDSDSIAGDTTAMNELIKHFPKITKFGFMGSSLNIMKLCNLDLRSLVNLQEVNLTLLSDRELGQIFRTCKQLRTLKVYSAQFHGSGFRSLHQCKHLQNLYIFKNEFAISEEAFGLLASSRTIRKLTLRDCGVNDNILELLLTFPQNCIQYLDISKNGNVSSSGFKDIHQATKLEQLVLSELELYEEGLISLAKSSSIHRLELANCNISSLSKIKALVPIESATHSLSLKFTRNIHSSVLEYLSSYNKLRYLNLSNCELDDETIAPIFNSPSIERLDVSYNTLSNNIAPSILRNKILKSLNLFRNGKISEETIDYIFSHSSNIMELQCSKFGFSNEFVYSKYFE